jgi:hypothetical protein
MLTIYLDVQGVLQFSDAIKITNKPEMLMDFLF